MAHLLARFVALKQLGCHCNRDRRRVLVLDAVDADRTGDRRELRRLKATREQPALELVPFAGRADETEVCEVGALQDALRERFIQSMTVRHHEEKRVCRCGIDLRFWHVSIITNGLALVRHPERYHDLLRHLDLLTLSIDQTRAGQYPDEMRRLTQFLPQLAELCRRHRVTLTRNYTATWEELADPARVRAAVEPHRAYFRTTYVMPVRQAGKTPLPLLKNSTALNREYSVAPYAFPDYPERERVEWYREHCDPKLKIKVDANGGLVYPCENHSYSAGSLEEHSIRELWTGQVTRYPNESCLGCGKQRFRSHLFKHPRRLAAAAIGVTSA